MSYNILFTSVGRRVALVEAFRSALSQLGINGILVGADVSRTAPAMHVMDKAYAVPLVNSSSYIPNLLELCRREAVSLLIPLIDPELPFLAREREKFLQIGTTVLVSDPPTVEIAWDKRKTYAFFLENGFDAPRLYDLSGGDLEHLRYPVMMKPALGSAAVGVTKVTDRQALEFYAGRMTDAVLQEYIEGDEYTLDVLADLQGRVRCVVPHKRIEVRAGEVSKAVTVRSPMMTDIARRVVESLPGPLGPITVQGFLTKHGQFKLIEINPRFGGGHPLAIRAGANFPRWIIEMMVDAPSSINPDGWRSGLVMLRYDEAIFLDEQEVL